MIERDSEMRGIVSIVAAVGLVGCGSVARADALDPVAEVCNAMGCFNIYFESSNSVALWDNENTSLHVPSDCKAIHTYDEIEIGEKVWVRSQVIVGCSGPGGVSATSVAYCTGDGPQTRATLIFRAGGKTGTLRVACK